MKRQILICVVVLFALVASTSAKEVNLQKLINSKKLIDAQAIVDRFEADEKRVKVIVNLSEPVPMRAMTNWKSRRSVRALRAEIASRQKPVLSSLKSTEFSLRHRFENQTGFSGEVTAHGLSKLLDNPMVTSVEPVRIIYPLLAQGIPLMNALAPSRVDMYNGEGMAIAICDTGVDYTHPRLGGGGFPNSKVIGGYDTGDNDYDPMPNSNLGAPHGTCCAGIAAGDLGTVGDYIGGVAYDAKIYAIKMSPDSDPENRASTASMVAAWDWCVTHQYDDPYNPIMVISTSFGGDRFFSPGQADIDSPAMTAAANNAVAAGITVLAASGNDGYCDSMSWPAAISNVISVGAVYDASVGTYYPCISVFSCATKYYTEFGCFPYSNYYAIDYTYADMVTSYSNTASFLDILAPSNRAYTTDIVGSDGYSSSDYYAYFGGTSAACPYAAGAVACLQSAALAKTGSYLTPEEIRDLLTTYGDPVIDDKIAITKPRVNLGRTIDFINVSLTVITPNGGEVWVAGRTYDILWDSTGDIGDVKIELYKGGVLRNTIVSSTSNDGLFSWEINPNQQTGSDYKIRISSVSYPDFYDESNSNFGITFKAFITVNSPDGGESLLRGTSYNITWDSVGAAGNYVNIDLYRGGQFDRSIVSSTSNDGLYNWYIEPNDPNLQTGPGYRIKVTSTSKPNDYYDYSKSHFSITEPGITVTSPDGGEFLQRGILYNIAWDSQGGTGDYVKIDLYKASSYDSTITSLTSNDGSYSWSVPPGLASDSDYSVKIASTSEPNNYYDFSDSYFSIGEVPWIEQAKLIASDGAANENFAYFVSINADYVIVGAYGDDDNGTDSGSAYILKRDGENWVQQKKLTASDSAACDYFGCSVAIRGDYAIVGSRGDDDNGSNSGSAYIFKRDGTNWVQQAKLTTSDGTASDNFSCSVSIDGDYAIVGAYGDDDKGANSGSAYIFKRDGTNWIQQAKLIASDGDSGDLFGYSVSISGDYAIIGAWGSGGSGTGCCAAYIFKRDGQSWTQRTKLTAPDGSSCGDFGCSVSINDDYAIVGAYSADGSVSDSGAAYVFNRTGANWAYQTKLIASDGTADDDFGCSVSINGGYAVVGTRWDNDNGDESGSAYVFKREGANWAQHAKITASDGAAYDYLGYSVSVSGQGHAIVGAWGDDDSGGSSGSAYLFTALTVLTPNGGEPWLRGNKYNITWNSTSSVGSSVKIELLKAGALEKVIASSTTNDGSYSWSIPSAQVVSSDYKIKISSTSNPSYYDYSDSYFSISDEVYTRLYVDQSAAGLNNGTSWADAFTELQSALAFALSGQEIWVAEGTYLPDYNVNTATHTGERSASFDLVNGAAIYGGFPAGGSLWQDRDPNIYETILSGDVNTPDDATDNSYHVVTASGTDEMAILDGFIITAGHADDSYPNYEGGGMYNNSGSPTLANCTFIGNSAGYLGGGMYNNSGNPRLTNCTFTNNAAVGGGGMYNYNSSPILTNCTFKNNSGERKGGEGAGMFTCHNSNPILIRCAFSDNSAELYGGGTFAFDNSSLKFINCTFSGNSADREGGGIYNYDSSLTLTNCIIWGNSDSYGAIESSQLKGIPLLNYNCIQNWGGSLGGSGNIGADPLFADEAAGDYHLKSKVGRWDPNSQTWVRDVVTSPCIDAGDPNSDWSAELGPNGERINMGVYGGTPEASMSIPDLNNDGFVNIVDLMRFKSNWLCRGISLSEDLNKNGVVNFIDFAIFADNWLCEE